MVNEPNEYNEYNEYNEFDDEPRSCLPVLIAFILVVALAVGGVYYWKKVLKDKVDQDDQEDVVEEVEEDEDEDGNESESDEHEENENELDDDEQDEYDEEDEMDDDQYNGGELSGEKVVMATVHKGWKKLSSDDFNFEFPPHYEILLASPAYPVLTLRNDHASLEIFKRDDFAGGRGLSFTGEESQDYLDRHMPKKFLEIEDFEVWVYYRTDDELSAEEMEMVFDSIELK